MHLITKNGIYYLRIGKYDICLYTKTPPKRPFGLFFNPPFIAAHPRTLKTVIDAIRDTYPDYTLLKIVFSDGNRAVAFKDTDIYRISDEEVYKYKDLLEVFQEGEPATTEPRKTLKRLNKYMSAYLYTVIPRNWAVHRVMLLHGKILYIIKEYRRFGVHLYITKDPNQNKFAVLYEDRIPRIAPLSHIQFLTLTFKFPYKSKEELLQDCKFPRRI